MLFLNKERESKLAASNIQAEKSKSKLAASNNPPFLVMQAFSSSTQVALFFSLFGLCMSFEVQCYDDSTQK